MSHYLFGTQESTIGLRRILCNMCNNSLPFVVAYGFALLLYITFNTIPQIPVVSIIVLFSLSTLVDYPHFFATYVHIDQSNIFTWKNPHIWGSAILCTLPLWVLLVQLPWVNPNCMRAEVMIFQIFFFIATRFHTVMQHWGVLRRETQGKNVHLRTIRLGGQGLIFAITSLPYTYILSKKTPYFSMAQDFPVSTLKKTIAMIIIGAIFLAIEGIVYFLKKNNSDDHFVFLQKILTVTRRSFGVIACSGLGYIFYQKQLFTLLFIFNATAFFCLFLYFLKNAEFKFDNSVKFICRLLIFELFLGWLASCSAQGFTIVLFANVCLHGVQYLTFVHKHANINAIPWKNNFLIRSKYFKILPALTVFLLGLQYFYTIVRLETIVYLFTFILMAMSLHHYYLDSIIWRRPKAA